MARGAGIQTIAAVVFDKDGVLADSEPINVRSARDVFARHGYVLRPEAEREIVGRHPRDYFPSLARPFGLSERQQRDMLGEKEALYAQMWKADGRLFEGVREVLATIRARFSRLGIATSSSRSELDAFLERFELKAFFQVTLSRDDVVRVKPAPDIYLAAAAMLGAAPQNVVVVEDSEPGVRSAHAAQTFCVALRGDHLDPGALSLVDQTIADLRELPGLLTKIGRAA